MLQKILVATDGSEHAKKAIEFASHIALECSATICLLHVAPESSLSESVFEPGILQRLEEEGISQLPQDVRLRKAGEDILEAARWDVNRRGVQNVQSAVVHGDPAEGILSFAKENSMDMIVVGSRGLGRLEALLLGSVSQKVCYLADCPVAIVK